MIDESKLLANRHIKPVCLNIVASIKSLPSTSAKGALNREMNSWNVKSLPSLNHPLQAPRCFHSLAVDHIQSASCLEDMIKKTS